MIDSYKTVFEDNEILFKEKGSKFIGLIFHVKNKFEADEILQKVRQKYYDATHHCYAYQLNLNNFQYSDDGEPNNTAGKPIFDSIQQEGLIEVLVVVVRYYGGTKLGTGGLIRAYGQSAKDVISDAEIKTVIIRDDVLLTHTYDETNTVMHVFNQFDCEIVEQQYLDDVSLTLAIRRNQTASFIEAIFEQSNGKIKAEVIK